MKRISIVIILAFLFSTLSGQESMLCQGRHWTEDEGNLMHKKFASQWNTKVEWEQRAANIKANILEGMQYEKMSAFTGAPKVIIHSSREMDGYIVENIAIETFPGFYATGNLYRPSAKRDSYAAILSPHGHLKDKRFTHYMQKRCAMLARMGAVVVAYDMVGYAESTQVTHKMPIAMLLQTWNSKRILDYLLSRPDVDPIRVGMTGGSGGGTQTFLFTAIDDRITASLPAVQVSAHFFGGCVCESGMPIHKSETHQTSNVEIAALCAPRPMMMLSDGDDWTRNTPRIEYPYIQSVYALYDAEHKVENVHLALERHDYGYSKRAAAYNFFGHHLNLNIKIPYDDGYDESFIKILSRDELSVFTEESPRPANALIGDEVVMKYLEIE